MAGRHRMPSFRDIRDDPRGVLHRGPPPLTSNSISLEDELELQYRDIQRLITDNRHVIDENVMLQRDLNSVKDEIHRLNQIIPTLNADKEAHRRELIERGMKLEAELRSIEPMRAEVVQLRAEAQKLSGIRQELSSQVQTLSNDIKELQAGNKQIPSMKTDIDSMRNDLVDARRVYEYEKKGNEELALQNQSMEKNLISMAREIEKLRAEQASADRSARGIEGYGHETGYLDPYGAGSWGSYSKHGPPRH